jgi:hypothetical protein
VNAFISTSEASAQCIKISNPAEHGRNLSTIFTIANAVSAFPVVYRLFSDFYRFSYLL